MYLSIESTRNTEVDMTRAVTVLAVVSGILLSTEARAQGEDWENPGLWVAAGGGYGLATTECARCGGGSQGSFSLLAGVGGSASRSVRFGIEGVGWFQSTADTAREYFGATALVQWFPVKTIPLSVQVGVGGGRVAQEAGGDLIEAAGFNIQLGANYDYYFSRHFALRPFFRYLFSRGLTTKLNRQVQFTDLNFGLLYFGVAVTWIKL